MTASVDTPDTTPVPDTVATETLPVLHEPPPVAFVKLMVPPIHTPDTPLIVPASGNGFTVIIVVVLPPAMV